MLRPHTSITTIFFLSQSFVRMRTMLCASKFGPACGRHRQLDLCPIPDASRAEKLQTTCCDVRATKTASARAKHQLQLRLRQPKVRQLYEQLTIRMLFY